MENPDFYYAAATHGCHFLVQAAVSGLLVCYLAPFLRERRHAWAAGGAYCAVVLFLYVIPYSMSGFVAYGLGCLAAFFVLCWLERENIWQKLYLMMVFFSFRWLLVKMASALYVNLYHYFFLLPYTSGSQWVDWWRCVGALLAENLFYLVFFDLAVRLFHRAHRDKKERITGREFAVMACPCLAMVLWWRLLIFEYDAYERGTGQSPFDWYGAYQWIIFFYCGVSVIIILVMAMVLQRLKREIREQRLTEHLQGQVEEIKRHVRTVEALYRDVQEMRHDMKNHLVTLEKLYEKGNYTEAGQYVARLREISGDSAEATGIHSGHPVTDVILREKESQALEQGIAFECRFFYPEQGGVDAFDVSVILNNALDNAIEAAGKCGEPEISLVSHCRRRAYLIEITNTCRSAPVTDGEFPASTKAGEGHGIGLVSIRRVAEKYHGTAEVVCDGERFTLTVLLMAE